MAKAPETQTPALQPARWPFLPTTLQGELEQMIDRFEGLRAEFGPRLVPAVDMSETDDAVEITAEVPGLSADEIEATIVQDRLVLKGGHDDTREKAGKDWHMVERRSGSFRRVLPLGFTPEGDGMEAKLTNGVLHLKIAKPSEVQAKSRKIEIESA